MNNTDPLIVFVPSGKRGRVPDGTSVLSAARMLGVDLDSVCGGRGICSRCQVTPSFGSFPKHGIEVTQNSISTWNKVEDRYKNKRGLKQGRRLGCQAKIIGDLVIDVPPESQVHKQVIRKSADTRLVVMDPSLRLYYIEVAEPDMHNPAGDLDRVLTALEQQWQVSDVDCDMNILTILQKVLRQGNWTATLAIHKSHKSGYARIAQIWPGYYDGSIYGFAVDVGSTTIAAHLCDLHDGSVKTSCGIMNPQIRFGEDLMSRVSYAMLNEGGSIEMTNAVREAISTLFLQAAEQAEINLDSILEVVLVCNPVMHHLLLGIDPIELGQAPFALATASSIEIRAHEIEINSLNKYANVYILPCVAGHVGADAAAVILTVEPQLSNDKVLIIDVGTNAEIIFGDQSRVLACSSPTGPAFEGAQISAGQRATQGAIEQVRIDKATLEPRIKVIGCELWSDEVGFAEETKISGVSGICGSGIIEAIAEMRICGLVDKSGLIASPDQVQTSRLFKDGRTSSYILYRGDEDDPISITVTQNDVRAIQLAKSALNAGAKLLMEHYGSTSVDRIVLAGAFGSHISTKHAMVLGMIPDCDLEKVSSVGNAAGTGARIALCSLTARKRIEDVVAGIEKIETAIEPKFQEHFVNANALPHAVDHYVHLETVVTLPDLKFNIGGSHPTSGTGRRRRKRN